MRSSRTWLAGVLVLIAVAPARAQFEGGDVGVDERTPPETGPLIPEDLLPRRAGRVLQKVKTADLAGMMETFQDQEDVVSKALAAQIAEEIRVRREQISEGNDAVAAAVTRTVRPVVASLAGSGPPAGDPPAAIPGSTGSPPVFTAPIRGTVVTPRPVAAPAGSDGRALPGPTSTWYEQSLVNLQNFWVDETEPQDGGDRRLLYDPLTRRPIRDFDRYQEQEGVWEGAMTELANTDDEMSSMRPDLD